MSFFDTDLTDRWKVIASREDLDETKPQSTKDRNEYMGPSV